jgi:hypothetical protein
MRSLISPKNNSIKTLNFFNSHISHLLLFLSVFIILAPAAREFMPEKVYTITCIFSTFNLSDLMAFVTACGGTVFTSGRRLKAQSREVKTFHHA